MRMSASSSTIRMSCAMADRAQFQGLLGCLRTRRPAHLRRSEDQADASALWLSVFQHQLCLVVFHNLFDDRKTQARPFQPSRDIRFGQPLAVLPRQALSVVFDDNGGLALFFDY